MEEVWNGGDVWNTNTDDSVCPTIRVNGENMDLDVGDNFKDVIKEASLEAGFGKFRVILDGEEILPSQAPELVEAGMRIEVLPYDVPGAE